MSLRATLLAILSAFGLALLALLSLQGWQSYTQYEATQRSEALNETRHALLRAVLSLRNDQLKLTEAGFDLERPLGISTRARAPAERALDHIEAALTTLPRTKLADLAHYEAELAREHDMLDDLRVMSVTGASPVQVSFLIENHIAGLLKLRAQMLEEFGFSDVTLALLHLLRNYAISVHAQLTDSAVALAPHLAADHAAPLAPEAREALLRRAGQAGGAAEALFGVFLYFDTPPVQQAAALSKFMQTDYVPSERSLISALATGDAQAISRAADSWLDLRLEAESRLDVLIDIIFHAAQNRTAEQQHEALLDLRGWLGLSVLALGIYLGSATLIWLLVAQPLQRIRQTMLRLAEGDLTRTPTRHELVTDLRQMSDALRVFRINAVRRERLQRERLELHARIAEAHTELRADLEAAAVVQRSQLPTPGIIGDFRFSALYRPSRMLAGDSFDFMPLEGGGARIFQIDVAGHGAAASLVSVAAHVALKRALEHLAPGGSLAETLETINANWSPELAYFTVLVIEIDAKSGVARMVQAGHPYPAVLRRDGTLERLGHGGLPVGILPHADFEEVRFDLGPGDRLLVFSDGLYEAVDPDGRMFGEARLEALLRAHAGCSTADLVARLDASLQDWSGSDHMDDDISLVVAEKV